MFRTGYGGRDWTYTACELAALNRYDVTPPRAVQFFSNVPPGTSQVSFTLFTAYDITFNSARPISRLPDKSSAADPLPVSMMKLVADEIAPCS